MNNSALTFSQEQRTPLQEASPGPQQVQLTKTQPFPTNSIFCQSQPGFFSAMAPNFPAIMQSDTPQYSLSTAFGNDLNRFENFQQVEPGHSTMMVPQQPQQQQQYSADFLMNLMNQKVQTPVFDDQVRQRLQTNSTENLVQVPRFDDACFFMPQGNGMNIQSLNRQPFALPSPHELTLGFDHRRMRGGVIEPFPEKLHRLLTEVEAACLSDVISFIAGGKAFAIHKPDKFFKEIVPKYFRQSRLSSFKRQLNLYGFELINTGPARGGYYHDLFVKDHPELCRRMRRVAVKVQVTKQQGGNHKGDDFFPLPSWTHSDTNESEANTRQDELEQIVPRTA
jgi:HSF-type DNA-binding